MSNYYGSGGGGDGGESSAGGGYGGGSSAGGGNPYFNGGYAQPPPPPPQEQQQQFTSQQNNYQQQTNNATTNNIYGQTTTTSHADPNQWQQQQQQQYGMQQQSSASSFMNASNAMGMFAAGMSAVTGSTNGNTPNAMLKIISPHAESFLKDSTARLIPGLESLMTTARRYFAVDNRYVKRKLQRIFCPFLCKSWTRQIVDAPIQQQQQSNKTNLTTTPYALPHSDENAPDLYIPFMSFVTYVLLCALAYGNAGQFSPEVLPEVATWCFMSQVLEVLLIRFGFYMMQAPVAMLDLLAYTGYKYFGLCWNMLGAIAANAFGLGMATYYVLFLYTASAASYFMLKTMANNIPREMMVMGFAASQFATMYFVSKTKFLT